MRDPSATDALLLAQIARGESDAAEQFAARHLDALWRFARRMGAEPDIADDLVQESLLSALRAAGSFRGEGSARAWLFTIARNAWHHAHRRRAGQPAIVEELPEDDSLASLGAAAGWGTDPERALAAAEDAVLLDAALGRLGEADRLILVLRDIEGLDTAEAAAALGITANAAKVRLHRARLRLMATLQEGGSHAR